MSDLITSLGDVRRHASDRVVPVVADVRGRAAVVAAVAHQPGEDKFPPTTGRRTSRVSHHRGTGGCGYPAERDEQAGEVALLH